MHKFFALLLLAPIAIHAQAPAASNRQSGTVKSVDVSSITLTTPAGADVKISVGGDAPVLQLAPGSTDLKSATPSALASVAPGDRVLITTKAADPSAAVRVIVIKATAIAARNTASQEEWQRHGSGGIVKSIDAPDLTIASGARTVKVVTTSATIFRRYASDSVKFEDARPSTLAQISTGDQMSVRGARSDDGSAITADEIVTGRFENLSGVLTAANASSATITLKDLATRRDVTVNLTSNSDIRHLPVQAAAAFANRNAGGAGAGAARANGGAPGGGEREGGNAAGRSRSAGMDLSRMLSHLPSQTIADLKPGDTVMIVASQGRGPDLTAITVLTGVEQILSSTSSSSQPITLSPWNLGGVPEGGGSQ